MNRALALTIGFLAILAPAMACAQTNIDQGKSASQIFANACADCHKSAGGLGKGKNAATVAEFLREHYTTGREQAASLAAYVVGGRDTVASPAPGRKPATTAATTEESKPDRRHGQKPAKPDETPGIFPSFMNPIVRTEPSRENRPATANRTRRNEPAAPTTAAPPPAEPPQEPAAVAPAPAATAATAPPRQEAPPPAQEAAGSPASATAPTAAAPTEAPVGETGESVPRDNIPD